MAVAAAAGTAAEEGLLFTAEPNRATLLCSRYQMAVT